MDEPLLDFSSDDSLAGFRLQTLEVFNWGTFHKKVWRLDLGSRNGLLTGDIGSGKSTLVDAVTTLLVPAHRVAYNKAAGADTRERSLRSYVQGYYKSERSDIGHTAKSVALRDHNSFSVILGVFKNKGFVQEVTLAQVFWIKEAQGQPERFYLTLNKIEMIRTTRSAQQFHICLFRCSIAFSAVASHTGTNQMFPRITAASGARHNMIDRQRTLRGPTILTAESIPFEDISPRQFDSLVGYFDKIKQTDHTGERHRLTNGTNSDRMLFYDFHLLHTDQNDGLLGGYHHNRLIILVEQKHLSR